MRPRRAPVKAAVSATGTARARRKRETRGTLQSDRRRTAVAVRRPTCGPPNPSRAVRRPGGSASAGRRPASRSRGRTHGRRAGQRATAVPRRTARRNRAETTSRRDRNGFQRDNGPRRRRDRRVRGRCAPPRRSDRPCGDGRSVPPTADGKRRVFGSATRHDE